MVDGQGSAAPIPESAKGDYGDASTATRLVRTAVLPILGMLIPIMGMFKQIAGKTRGATTDYPAPERSSVRGMH